MAKLVWVALGLVGTAAVAGGVYFWSIRFVETPEYAVERKQDAIELRRYPAVVVASVARGGDRSHAVRSGFGPLARYIFARERGGEKIAMTAPVTQAQNKDAWVVSFIMPAGRTVEDLPIAGGDVKLEDIPPRRMAAIRFSGRWTDENFSNAERALRDWIDREGLTAKGALEYAYYNDPFTPAFLRRNEVMLEIAD